VVGVGDPEELARELARAREQVAQLQEALQSSRTIGIAVGMVAARHGLTPEAAFAFLSRTSQTTNVKLRDVAAIMLETGELPTGG
jgi:AmiR/NasT family two-component response regulator